MTKEELKQEILKALKGTQDYEWLPAHNGKAKFVYLQTVIDIVNEQFELASAEPREKRIAELEAQYKDLEWQLKEVLKDNDYYQAENERLKEKRDSLQELVTYYQTNFCQEG